MTSTPLIVLVEDEDHLAQGLLFNLQTEGYRTHHEADGDAPSGPHQGTTLTLRLPLATSARPS